MQTGQQVSLRERSKPASRTWFLLYVGFVTLYTLVFAVVMTHTVSPFLTGDWLINYSGGFVRRGLVGSLVLLLSRTGLSSVWIVFAIEASTFSVFVGCVYRLTAGIRWTYWMAAVVLSPATLSFTVMDSYVGVRKETLLFAALAATLCVLVFGHLEAWQLILMLSVFSLALTLSHEALVIGAPYFFAAVAIRQRSVLRAVKICLIPALLGAIALMAVVLHPGNLATAKAVCSSWGLSLSPYGSADQNLCSGSIAWLQFNLSEARDLTLASVCHYHRVRLYSFLSILTFAPFVGQLIVLWRGNRRRRELTVLLGCAFMSMLGTGILLSIAMDWGRWIHLQAICLMLMMLMLDRRFPDATTDSVATTQQGPLPGYAWMLAVALYAGLWTLPPTGRGDGQRGYLDAARTVRSLYRARHAPKASPDE